MKNRYVVLILFILFVLEGSLVVPWLIPLHFHTQLALAPHLTFVALLIFALHRNRHLAALVGFAIGLCQEIVYASPMLGPHAFCMAFAAYAAGIVARRIKLNMAFSFIMIALCLVFYDLTLYSVFRLFRVTTLSYGEMFTQMLVPDVLFNLLFAVIVYVPARKVLEIGGERREEEG